MRNLLFKLYSLTFFLATLSLGFGFAANDDCRLATTGVDATTWSVYSGAFPYENLLLARKHLYAYCCRQGLFAAKDTIDCSQAPKEVALESKFMFEHLVDIGFRSLDVSAAYSGQLIDSGAKAWYAVMHPTGDKQALTPLMVETQYKNYWSLTQEPLLQNLVGNGDIKTYLPLYSGFSLRDKYYNLCFVIKHLYNRVLQPQENNWSLIIGDDKDPNSNYTKCMNLAEYKKEKELTLTHTLMLEGSNATLKNSMETYLQTNFLQDGFQTLLGKLQSVVALFQKIVRQAPISSRCAR